MVVTLFLLITKPKPNNNTMALKSKLNQKPLSMTDEEIEAWETKQENDGKLPRKLLAVTFESEVSDSGETTFLIARPTRHTINSLAEMSAKKDFDGANSHLINSCVIAGDVEELEKDDELYFGLIEEIGKLAGGKKKIS
jgi:hypothetical protein